MGIVHPFPHARIVASGGPVSRAVRVMRAMSPAEQRALLPQLRQRIEDEIEASLSLLDLIDGDPDFEIGTDDNGLADEDGWHEQRLRDELVAL